jgi:hypothetical protein
MDDKVESRRLQVVLSLWLPIHRRMTPNSAGFIGDTKSGDPRIAKANTRRLKAHGGAGQHRVRCFRVSPINPCITYIHLDRIRFNL